MRPLKFLFIVAALAGTPVMADDGMTVEKLGKTGANDCPAKLATYKPAAYKDVCTPMADCNSEPKCVTSVRECQIRVDAQAKQIYTYNNFIRECAKNKSRLDRRVETKTLKALLQ